ncbi:unnamed protein product [Tenebrio molitor]|nr:unnamed protein product [Tenebrio molitor]
MENGCKYTVFHCSYVTYSINKPCTFDFINIQVRISKVFILKL